MKFMKDFNVLSKLMAASPWILVITGIALDAYLIIKNWDKISAWFKWLWDNVKRIFSTAFKVLAALVINFTPAGLIYKHWGGISAFFSKVWASVKAVFSVSWDWIKNMFLNYTPYGLVIKHWEGLLTFFTKLWDNIKAVFSSAMDWIKNSWVGSLISRVAGGIHSGISAAGRAIDYALKHNLGATVNQVGGLANGLGIGTYTAPLPTPVPKRGGGINAPFNMTVHLSGAATQKDANMFGKAAQAAFKKHYDLMQHNQQRISFGF
jgi:phage-related protein